MTPAVLKPCITLDLLNQIDIRVGTIQAVTDVANSDKLVQLRVSFGDHERTIVAGLKQERADPREIEGKEALFVVNLEARSMRGVVSEGFCLISAMPMECVLCWRCQTRQCRMAR